MSSHKSALPIPKVLRLFTQHRRQLYCAAIGMTILSVIAFMPQSPNDGLHRRLPNNWITNDGITLGIGSADLCEDMWTIYDAKNYRYWCSEQGGAEAVNEQREAELKKCKRILAGKNVRYDEINTEIKTRKPKYMGQGPEETWKAWRGRIQENNRKKNALREERLKIETEQLFLTEKIAELEKVIALPTGWTSRWDRDKVFYEYYENQSGHAWTPADGPRGDPTKGTHTCPPRPNVYCIIKNTKKLQGKTIEEFSIDFLRKFREYLVLNNWRLIDDPEMMSIRRSFLERVQKSILWDLPDRVLKTCLESVPFRCPSKEKDLRPVRKAIEASFNTNYKRRTMDS